MTAIVSDPDPARRALATRFGAAGTVDPGQGGSSIRVLDSLRRDEIDVVVEASGARTAVITALEVIGTGGVVVLVGSVFPAAAVAPDAERIVRHLITLRGVHNYVAADPAAASAVVHARHRACPFAELGGETFPSCAWMTPWSRRLMPPTSESVYRP